VGGGCASLWGPAWVRERSAHTPTLPPLLEDEKTTLAAPYARASWVWTPHSVQTPHHYPCPVPHLSRAGQRTHAGSRVGQLPKVVGTACSGGDGDGIAPCADVAASCGVKRLRVCDDAVAHAPLA